MKHKTTIRVKPGSGMTGSQDIGSVVGQERAGAAMETVRLQTLILLVDLLRMTRNKFLVNNTNAGNVKLLPKRNVFVLIKEKVD